MNDTQKSLLYRYLLITCLVLAVFGNTLTHRFVWDDYPLIVDSPATASLSNIPRFFVMEDMTDTPTGYYRPITYVSFALDRAVWGLNPVGYNLTNLILHLLTTLVFFRVVAVLFRRENLALAAALLFTLHPVVVETVSFHAGGRNTLLSALFGLLALLCYVKKKDLAGVAFFTLAIFSKEFALLMPAFFFLYDVTLSDGKKKWLRYVPYAAAGIAYLTVRSFVVKTAANLLSAAHLQDNIWIVPQTLAGYLKNMLFPFQLKTMYQIDTHVTWTAFLGCATLIAALVAVAVVFRKRREIVFAVAMFLLFLLPVSNIFFLGTAMMADRYAYFASFGFSLGLAYCICLAPKKVALAGTAVVCLLMAPMTVHRNGIWQDEVSLFTQMVQDAPEMAIPYQNLGYAYHEREDYPNTDKYLSIAFTKKGLNGMMLDSSATMFLEMDEPEKAIQVLQTKINFEPSNAQSYIMISRIYQGLGKRAEAESYHAQAKALAVDIDEILRNRVLFLVRQGEGMLVARQTVKAQRRLKEALSMDPLFVPALIDMGSIAAQKGDMPKAQHYFSRAVALEPANASAHYNLSMVHEAMGRPALARAEMERFNELRARQGSAAAGTHAK